MDNLDDLCLDTLGLLEILRDKPKPEHVLPGMHSIINDRNLLFL